MKTLNIRKEQQVLLSFEHKAYLLKSQSLVVKNTKLQDRVGELEAKAALDKIEIAQNLQDYKHLSIKLDNSLCHRKNLSLQVIALREKLDLTRRTFKAYRIENDEQLRIERTENKKISAVYNGRIDQVFDFVRKELPTIKCGDTWKLLSNIKTILVGFTQTTKNY